VPDSFLNTRNDKERQLNKNIVMDMYRTISEKACLNTPNGDWNLIRSHKMRSYFDSVLKGAGCDSFHVEFWLGHKMDGTKSAYFRAKPESEKERNYSASPKPVD
jgi:integrase